MLVHDGSPASSRGSLADFLPSGGFVISGEAFPDGFKDGDLQVSRYNPDGSLASATAPFAWGKTIDPRSKTRPSSGTAQADPHTPPRDHRMIAATRSQINLIRVAADHAQDAAPASRAEIFHAAAEPLALSIEGGLPAHHDRGCRRFGQSARLSALGHV
jgi:hypothetical protein